MALTVYMSNITLDGSQFLLGLTMDNTVHRQQDDSSDSNGENESNSGKTIKNSSQHQDLSLPNSGPQGKPLSHENLTNQPGNN